ncbi:MAG: hypothetical protein LBS60_11080 [Deltaproteobacteria bacterium]|jgi:hypothetical protein|nr:hypothetical protein [Deltaproteobacteria bacterium]
MANEQKKRPDWLYLIILLIAFYFSLMIVKNIFGLGGFVGYCIAGALAAIVASRFKK